MAEVPECVALARLERVAAGDFEAPEVREWLRDGAAAWLRADGCVTFGQCLRLPVGPATFARAARNLRLRQAAALLVAPSDWARAQLLAERVRHFEQRLLASWRKCGGPPHGADAVCVFLWLASRCEVPGEVSRGLPNSAQALHRIITPLQAP